jgi:beta-lactamase class A
MSVTLALFVAATLCSLSFDAAVQATGTSDLRDRVAQLIQASGAEKAGIAFRDLGSGETLDLDAAEVFNAASVMKVPVMLEVFRLAEAGTLSLDQPLTVKLEFASLADGSPFKLSPEDDADPQLYKLDGQGVPVRDLVERMITKSSNLATNLMIDRIGADHVTAFMEKLGTKEVRVLRGVMDEKAFDKGLNNTITARGIATILQRIARRRAVSRKASNEMLRILLAQEHNNGIPAGLPPDWRVAHKTGWFTGTTHDAAIVYPPGRAPYILVVLTRGIADEARANRLIADISRAVHDSLNHEGAEAQR